MKKRARLVAAALLLLCLGAVVGAWLHSRLAQGGSEPADAAPLIAESEETGTCGMGAHDCPEESAPSERTPPSGSSDSACAYDCPENEKGSGQPPTNFVLSDKKRIAELEARITELEQERATQDRATVAAIAAYESRISELEQEHASRDCSSDLRSRQSSARASLLLPSGHARDGYSRNVENIEDLEVDHLVPVAEMCDTGAASWSSEQRRERGADPVNLVVTLGCINRSKSSLGPADWLPSLEWADGDDCPPGGPHDGGMSDCEYVQRWTRIKQRWDLDQTPRNEATIRAVLDTCPSA